MALKELREDGQLAYLQDEGAAADGLHGHPMALRGVGGHGHGMVWGQGTQTQHGVVSEDTAIAPHDTMPGDTATGHDETQLCVLAETHSATLLKENPTKASPRSGATRALHVTARQAKRGG